MSLLTEFDLHLMAEGTHARLYEKLGAHLVKRDGIKGVEFAVRAPAADSVSVIGDFNRWEPAAHPMKRRADDSGVWESFIPGVGVGRLYKYSILSGPTGKRIDKADPFGFAAEIRPQTASKVWDITGYAWDDAGWLEERRAVNGPFAPVTIYEVHPGSWMRVPEEHDRPLSYREVAPSLA